MINRNIAPKTNTIHSIQFQQPEVLILNNGATMYAIRETASETIQIEFVFNAGTLLDDGIIAKATGDLLFSGSTKMTSSELEEKIDQLGGFKSVKVTKEEVIVSVAGLKENGIALAKIVVDAMKEACFPTIEIKQYLQASKQKMKIQLEKVGFVANREFSPLLFPNSSYGKVTKLADFDAVSQDEIIAFHQQHYLNGLNSIRVVGPLNDEEMNALQTLGNSFHFSPLSPPDFKFNYTPKTTHKEKKEALQSAIRIGRILFNRTNPDYKDFLVLNMVLGGYFGSRLMSSLREDKGYTYGIHSGIAQLNKTGYFYISTEVNKEFRTESIDTIRKEIEQLQRKEIDEEELQLVKNYIIGMLLEQSDGPKAMLDCFLSVNKYNLDLTYYNELIQAINVVSPSRLMQLAKTYLNWEDLIVVTVG